MTVLPWPAGQCPYVTPDQLSQWPTGVQWGTLPPVQGATAAQQYAVQAMICQQATVKAEEIARQTLRSVVTTEELAGPQFRVTVQVASLNGRIICSRTPVIQALALQVCPNSVWPRVWKTVPAGYYEPEFPVQGLYGTSVASGSGEGAQSILVAPGYINWRLRREGWRVKVTYLAGWPHTSLASAATASAGTISVDDCTMWAPLTAGTPGAYGIVYDAMGGGQETVSCTSASVAAGPGTLTLASPLSYDHAAGIMVSAMPQTVIWAAALLAGEAALMRGATATTIQTTSGRQQGTTGSALHQQACHMLHPYRPTI